MTTEEARKIAEDNGFFNSNNNILEACTISGDNPKKAFEIALCRVATFSASPQVLKEAWSRNSLLLPGLRQAVLDMSFKDFRLSGLCMYHFLSFPYWHKSALPYGELPMRDFIGAIKSGSIMENVAGIGKVKNRELEISADQFLDIFGPL